MKLPVQQSNRFAIGVNLLLDERQRFVTSNMKTELNVETDRMSPHEIVARSSVRSHSAQHLLRERRCLGTEVAYPGERYESTSPGPPCAECCH